ncbi:MAG: histidine kinase [Arcobacter sp.]|nr:MAG: histidine kinase [Arcobacter sp.]
MRILERMLLTHDINEIEVVCESNTVYCTCTNEVGEISCVNESFIKVSGYSEKELIGQNHNIMRHPDMPQVIYHLMWESLKSRKTFLGLIKNKTKDGSFYWLMNEISIMPKRKSDPLTYYAYKELPSKRAIFHISSLYKELLECEAKNGIKASAKYLDEYLSFRGVNYKEYLETFRDASGLFKVGYFMARKLFK